MADRNREDSSQPTSPLSHRRPNIIRHSSSGAVEQTERSPLLRTSRSRVRIQGGTNSPRQSRPSMLSRNHSYSGSSFMDRHHSRHPSWGSRLINALSDRHHSMSESKGSIFADDRVWYDQFTSTDWVHDAIADSHRVKALRSRKGVLGRLLVMLDGVQGWILSALSGFLIALVAYTVNVSESTIFDFKDGYCSRKWYLRERASEPARNDTTIVADDLLGLLSRRSSCLRGLA